MKTLRHIDIEIVYDITNLSPVAETLEVRKLVKQRLIDSNLLDNESLDDWYVWVYDEKE